MELCFNVLMSFLILHGEDKYNTSMLAANTELSGIYRTMISVKLNPNDPHSGSKYKSIFFIDKSKKYVKPNDFKRECKSGDKAYGIIIKNWSRN